MKIEDIKSPRDIKNMTIDELEMLAQDIRNFLITSVSKTGGHLGSSLGTVELIIALHYYFNSPEDKIIFDIGHQAYAHKILTGRASKFKTLRKKNGLSGFLKHSESIHDIWEAGHSSTSLSAALGFALQRELDHKDNNIITLIGDGSLTNGMIFEALNHIIELNQKIIIIINDNEMSISPNIGFIDKFMKNLEYSTSYEQTKKIVRQGLNKIDPTKSISKFISGSKKKLKENINSVSSFFNILGFKYLGPIDGHNIDEILNSLKKAETFEGPVVIHAKTIKGKGYKPAEDNKWHAVAKFDIKTGKQDLIRTYSAGKIVANYLDKLMEENKDIVVVSPAMLAGSSLNELKQKYKTRVTDAGIAEEHATTMVAALALSGKKPILSIYSTFLQRAYDQMFHDLARQNVGAVIAIDRAGLVGEDGETHQGIYDISFLSHMHEITITQGRNAEEIKGLLNLGFSLNKPFIIRYSKAKNYNTEDFTASPSIVEYGSWEKLTEGNKIYIIAYGDDVNLYAKEYANNLDVGVINARFIKPFDKEMLENIKDKIMLVVEEHTKIGGLGSLILNYMNEKKKNYKIEIHAIGDHFVEQGSVNESKQEEKIDVESIKKRVETIIDEKN